MFRMSKWSLLIFLQFISLLICPEGNIFTPSSTTKASNPPTTSTIPPSSSPTLSTNWCIARENASQEALQKALDYVCDKNRTAVDCATIQSGGVCFIPNTLIHHASYAMNLYYQNNRTLPDSCDFSGVGFITNIDPTQSLVTTTPITQTSLNTPDNATNASTLSSCHYLPTSTSASGFNTSLSGSFGGVSSPMGSHPASYSSTAAARISCFQMCYSLMLAFLMIISLARG
ncbi:unnamed protein product [Cuscuta europaea]|uniref:X8 domain-containing protein n=1 Tax=Cuscuta europaea TaxID=41803 RepID=A0A9P0ZQW6_CUSEU|nr:unnamed protein product [Cuscuta europaea]